MSSKLRSLFKLVSYLSAVVMLLISSAVFVSGQTDSTPHAAWVDDWSHHHLVFSNPGSYADAVKNGTVEKWLTITNDPRYKLQQLKRSNTERALAAAPDFAARTAIVNAISTTSVGKKPAPLPKEPLKKDWTVDLNGASAIGTVTTNNASGSPLSSVTINTTTLDASAPTPASATGTFTGNPTNGQTVTIGGSEVLTASLSTAATASITVGSSFCFANGQGVDVNGTTLTTNATAGSATFSVSTNFFGNPAGESVTIGGITYNLVSTLSGPTTYQVLVPPGSGFLGSWTSTNAQETAQNLAVAINNSGTCGYTSGGICTLNVSAKNPQVSSTNTASSAQTMTAYCAGNSAITNTGATNVTVNNIPAGSAGSTSGTNFALGSQTVTAANILSAVNNNSSTVTASAGSTGVVNLTAKTWGSSGNNDTLTENVTSGVSVSGSKFSGGVDGTNTGTSFAIDNVNDAANLASAITRNGGTVGVTANSAGSMVTVTATAGGTGGDSISLAEGLTNFSWSGSSLSGGGNGTQNGTTWTYWSGSAAATPAEVAANIASTINSNSTLDTQVTAVANGDQVIVTALVEGSGGQYTVGVANFAGYSWGTGVTKLGGGAASTVQPNAYPAKYGASLTSADCNNDFVLYPTGMTGTATAASIIAYNNLYSGCTGSSSIPAEYWAYNTGGAVTTSPIFSGDGTQLAFVQSSGTAASLVLLKWAATSGTLTVPVTPNTASSSANYRSGCTLPCMYTIAFHGGANDTFSAPVYDYVADDAIYVGDDSGKLHQFTGVFGGTPAENTNSPWPLTLNASNKVSTPVYDAVSGYVFVGDFGGVLYAVGTGTGSPVTTSGSIHGNSTKMGDAIADAPLVDGTAAHLYAFVTTSTLSGAYPGSNILYQYGTGFTGYVADFVSLGTGNTGYYLYSGSFDNVYFNASNGQYPSGNLYAIGNTGVTTGATLWRMPITSNALGQPVAAVSNLTPNATNAYPWPSPVGEFCNGACTVTTGGTCGAGVTCTNSGTDYLYFSVNRGNTSGCTNTAGHGCLMSYNVNTTTPAAETPLNFTTTTTTGQGCWATSGIVIDNSATFTGASQMYFINFNGIAAGGPVSGDKTSTNCTTGTGTDIIDAVQTSQANP